jgi:tRNA modification GTPase
VVVRNSEADPERETIAAIATPPGRGALAVVRVSGPDTVQVAERLGLHGLTPRTARLRRLEHPESGHPVDRVLATLFPGPASYTGEDLLEVSSHGGHLIPQLVLDAVLAAGARPAEPGEFTRRAYLNGRIDLLQAEATADLIDAASPALANAALRQLERGLSHRIETLRERLIEVQALLAYDIDFPEEDEGPVDSARVDAAVAALRQELDSLLKLAPEGEMLREGALTVIAGRPNAGKSSLFNGLVGFERAIVTEHPGTTRDAIEAVIGVDGYPFRLVDTAGLHETAEAVEEIGIEVARSYLGRAELVLFCVEDGRPLEPDETAFLDEWPSNGRTTILVRTKADLHSDENTKPPAMADLSVPQVRLSAKEGEGISALRKSMLDAAWSTVRARPEAPLVTRRRHVRALESARRSIEEFCAACEAKMPAEIAVTHLQDATLRLEELLGSISTEELLDRVFASFCVGK